MSPTPGDPTDRREVLNDLTSGSICLALAAGLAAVHFSQAGRLHENFGAEPGPAMLPQLLLCVLGLAGLGLLLRGLVGIRRARGAASRREDNGIGLWPVVGALVVVSLFLPMKAAIGAALALIAVGAALGSLAGWKEERPPMRSALEGAAVAAVLFVVFRFMLFVPLR